EFGLEPGELGAVGEDDPPDRAPVDPAVAEDALAPAGAQSVQQSFVLSIEAVNDVVAGDHGGAVALERAERLAFPGRDAACERDRERPLHYSVGSASSEATASGASASATGPSASASDSASAGGSSAATGSASATVSSSAKGSSSVTGSAS